MITLSHIDNGVTHPDGDALHGARGFASAPVDRYHRCNQHACHA
ncbi:hypothetical protein QWY79_13115 [Halomonas sabkhae]|nr:MULTISPECIES: hypothetical protein [Halomonas]MDN3526207.1 hypothetical protein [Halomonas sabkhae]